MFAAAAAAVATATAAHGHPSIPYTTLTSGGKLPLLVMGDGVGWGRGTNWTVWLDLVGPGAAIDSAWDYGTQPAIPPAIARSTVPREQVFITSKIPCDHWDGGVEPMNGTMAARYIAQDLAQLNTSYVDLMLLHHICASPAETRAVWKALEAMKRRGQARAIGVSNFEVADLEMLLQAAEEPIDANQCHFAVGEFDADTHAFCAKHGIALESYGTLHGGVPSSHPTVVTVAARHNVSTAVVMLRYVTQRGIAVVTASNSLQYDREDIAMFELTLTETDMAELDALQHGKTRTCSDCYKDSCRQCQAALKKAGCAPWGGADCQTCAAANAAAVMPVCRDEPMVYKACVPN